nr:hypothetical protein [Desulfobacula sp.]
MNFMFSDIGSSFLNMVQQDIPKELLSTDNTGSQKKTFASHFHKQVEKLDALDTSSSSPTVLEALQTGRDSASTTASLTEKLDQKKGTGFVTALKGILLKLSKGDLKNLSIDAQGLESLKKMLLTAGFKEGEINEIFSDLLETTKTGTLTLDVLMARLSALTPEKASEEEDEPEIFLETSALPFIESLLTSLGIDKDEIQKILAEADKGEKGISLDVILEKLKGIQKEAVYSRNAYETPESDLNYQHLMEQLGMEQSEEASSPLSLNEFVDALEELREKLSVKETGTEGAGSSDQKNSTLVSEKMPDLIAALFKGLESSKQTEKQPVFGFSYEQVKNQFENQLLLPDEKNSTAAGLFSVNKALPQESDTKPKDLNRAFELIAGQKKSSEAESGSFSEGSGGVLKQLRPEIQN